MQRSISPTIHIHNKHVSCLWRLRECSNSTPVYGRYNELFYSFLQVIVVSVDNCACSISVRWEYDITFAIHCFIVQISCMEKQNLKNALIKLIIIPVASTTVTVDEISQSYEVYKCTMKSLILSGLVVLTRHTSTLSPSITV